MLDMGFINDIRKIVAKLPIKRQTLFFSATMPKDIADLAEHMLRDPARVAVTPVSSTVERITQRVIQLDHSAKPSVLAQILKDEPVNRALVFTRTKHGADKVVKTLAKAGIPADAIHGNKSQNYRERVLAAFRTGEIRTLVATDIAARGIDVQNITHVINFELPDDPENYVHRIGRTARNGASGFAITLCDGTERGKLRDVERLIRKTLPVTGELKGAGGEAIPASEVAKQPIQRVAKQGQPRGERQNAPRKHANAGKHFSGAKKAAIVEGRQRGHGEGASSHGQQLRGNAQQVRGGAGKGSNVSHNGGAPATAPAWWEKPTGQGTPAPKQRWNKKQKDAGRQRREGERAAG